MGGSSRLLFFFFYGILIHLAKPTIAKRYPYGRDSYVQYQCSTNNSTSAYQANLNSLFSDLIYYNNQTNNGFYNLSAGENSDKVNVIALCRGDLTPTNCRSCVSVCAEQLLLECPNQKEGIMWYMNCTVRYSNKSIFGVMEFEPLQGLYSTATVSDVSGTFKQVRGTLLDSLRSKAASGDPIRKLATGAANSTYFNIYALLQCTPDLGEQECSNCLNQTIRYIPGCCDDAAGVRVLTPSCNLRYENNRFYDTTPDVLPPSSSPPPPAEGEVISSSTRKKSEAFFANKRRLPIVVVAILVTSFIILLFACWLIKRKRKGSKRRPAFYNDVIASSPFFQDSAKLDETERKPDVQFFDLSTIIAATDNFSPAKRLGQGGFGPVYKGELTNGQEIAVKTLSRSSKQGTEEFKNEVKLIAKLQHRNLVRLFGCCIHKEEKMLIYEYMPNKSLDFFIFNEIRRKLIDWRQRFEIISGIARGVLYLHQDSRLKIIHRDLKAGNVLLDAAMNPKISDFGLARMFVDDQIEANTRKVVGTYGYMSPEYAMEGLYSIKSDVFSYGVLTLEIISGKRNNYHHIGSPSLNLIGHVWDLWMEGKAMDIVDSLLGQEYPAQEVLRCIQIGLLCVQEQATDRPTMLEIVFMLGNEAIVPSPNKPAFINRPINSDQDSLGSKGTSASLNEMTITMPKGR